MSSVDYYFSNDIKDLFIQMLHPLDYELVLKYSGI